MFRGCLGRGIYGVYTCIMGVHRCVYGMLEVYKGCVKGVYKGCVILLKGSHLRRMVKDDFKVLHVRAL